MAAKKFLRLVNGVLTEIFGVQASAGAGNAGDLVSLDDSGRIDNSMMPVGIGADTSTFQGVKETLTTANTGTAYTVANTAASILDLTLTGNCVLTYPAPSGGGQFTLLLKQDATGSRTVTWPSSVRWAGGTAPTLTATAGRTDVVAFLSDGTYWLGFVGGLDFTRA